MLALPRNVWLLTLILSLAMSSGAMMVMVGGVLGAQLASDPKWSTLPVAMMIIGTACGVVPVTRLMGRLGRKPVFIGVSLLITTGFLLAAYATSIANFIVFLSAAFIIGLSVSGFQQIRFAAMESVATEHMAKAASTVLLGGLVAAILGPELVTQGQDLLNIPFVGTFLLMACLGLLCTMLFMFFKETHIFEATTVKTKVDIGDVVTKPIFIVAVSSSAVGFALMSFIMTATPVHMHVTEHFSLDHTKWVIQSHILAMYLPSLVSGWIISRLGANRVIMLGLCLYLITIAVAFAGNQLSNYWLALILLGVGWNFLFLGGTVLLPTTHTVEQKFKVQSVNEFMVFGIQAIASLSAGAMLFLLGWQGLLFTSLAIILAHMSLLVWQSIRIRNLKHHTTEINHG